MGVEDSSRTKISLPGLVAFAVGRGPSSHFPSFGERRGARPLHHRSPDEAVHDPEEDPQHRDRGREVGLQPRDGLPVCPGPVSCRAEGSVAWPESLGKFCVYESPFENVILVRCVARISCCNIPEAIIHATLGRPSGPKSPVEGILKRSLSRIRSPDSPIFVVIWFYYPLLKSVRGSCCAGAFGAGTHRLHYRQYAGASWKRVEVGFRRRADAPRRGIAAGGFRVPPACRGEAGPVAGPHNTESRRAPVPPCGGDGRALDHELVVTWPTAAMRAASPPAMRFSTPHEHLLRTGPLRGAALRDGATPPKT